MPLVTALRAAEIDVWLDPTGISGGDRWAAKVQTALDESDWVLVVMSRSSVLSDNVLDEISYSRKAGKALLPVRIEECFPPLQLTSLHYIDLVRTDPADRTDPGFIRVVEALQSRKTDDFPKVSAVPLGSGDALTAEDATDLLLLAPAGVLRPLVCALASAMNRQFGFGDKQSLVSILTQRVPTFTWPIAVFGLIAAALAFQVGAWWLGVLMTLLVVVWVAVGVWLVRKSRRELAVGVRATLARSLPRRDMETVNPMRVRKMWQGIEPVARELTRIPPHDWAEHITQTVRDESQRKRVFVFLSVLSEIVHEFTKPGG